MMKIKNITIPTVLLSIVLVAGMFAFIPVQDASTVHDTIVSDFTGKVATSGTEGAPQNALVDDGEAETLTCTADFRLVSLVMDFDDDGNYGDDSIDVSINSIDVAQATVISGSNEILGDGSGGALVGSGADERVVTVTARDDGAGGGWDDDDEVLETIRASYISTGTCAWD